MNKASKQVSYNLRMNLYAHYVLSRRKGEKNFEQYVKYYLGDSQTKDNE